jgi:hypothetical protein
MTNEEIIEQIDNALIHCRVRVGNFGFESLNSVQLVLEDLRKKLCPRKSKYKVGDVLIDHHGRIVYVQSVISDFYNYCKEKEDLEFKYFVNDRLDCEYLLCEKQLETFEEFNKRPKVSRT